MTLYECVCVHSAERKTPWPGQWSESVCELEVTAEVISLMSNKILSSVSFSLSLTSSAKGMAA